MPATLSTIFRPALTGRPDGSIRRFLPPWLQDIARYPVRRVALRRLRELDDHELRDIGLARSQIEAAVCGLMPSAERGKP